MQWPWWASDPHPALPWITAGNKKQWEHSLLFTLASCWCYKAAPLPALGDPDTSPEGTSVRDIPIKSSWKLFRTYFPLSKTARLWLTKDVWEKFLLSLGIEFCFIFHSSFILVEQNGTPRPFLQPFFPSLVWLCPLFSFFSQAQPQTHERVKPSLEIRAKKKGKKKPKILSL